MIFLNKLTIHIHYPFYGIVGVMFFRGQPQWRYSIIAQALLLGAFVNGVTIWDVASWFNPAFQNTMEEYEGVSQSFLWTSLNATNNSVILEWTTSDVMATWNCTLNRRLLQGKFAPLSRMDNMTLSMNSVVMFNDFKQSDNDTYSHIFSNLP